MQLSISLPNQMPTDQDSLLLSSSNMDVWQWLSSWPNWPLPQVVVCGDEGSGKTHMARSLLGIYLSPENYRQYDQLTLVQSKSFLIIDDYDRFDDESWLFHLFNLIKEHHGQAVYFGKQTPSGHSFNLPDLASRLRSLPCLTIQEPDDDLFRQLLKKELYNKGIICGDEIMEYIYRRFDRSYETIHNLVQLIDDNTLKHQRSLSLPFFKEILGEN
ncbi:MAG: hypothetical protein KF820_00680 [Candidatus Paracaedibacteraceae bacterium]|nr:hypothetical protein [Candidatus Paracaedibacteraceae bacterium]